MNSFYGVLGTTGCRFHDQRLASSITRRGHQIINDSRDFIEDAGYKVIYGDTDSLFVHIDAAQSATACHRIGDELMNSLNDWWKKRLRKEFDLESHLEVEFETHFQRFLMPTVRGMATGSKKRYAGLVTGKDESPELMIKGLEAVRTDWTPLARDFQRELLRRVFTDQPFEDYVRTTAEQLSNGELVMCHPMCRRRANYPELAAGSGMSLRETDRNRWMLWNRLRTTNITWTSNWHRQLMAYCTSWTQALAH